MTIERAEAISKELGLELDTLLNFNPSNYLHNCSQSGIINAVNNNYYGVDKIAENTKNKLQSSKPKSKS